MLSEEIIDKVVERLVRKVEQNNEDILAGIGNKVDEIGKLQPTQAHQLVQMLKYGGDYEKIVDELKKATKRNKKDIKKMFEEVAKENQKFAEQFYKYRNKKYIPYDENIQLQRQVNAIAKLTNDKYAEFARSKAIGFSVKDDKGNIIFKGLRETYNDVIDKAVLNISQGKTTFDDEMYSILKNIGESGVKTLDFNGRTMRLDSAIRMHLKDSLREMNNDLQIQYGKEFGADGVEISVHLYPAPDHELVQGRQFSNDEFKKLQNDDDAVSYDGIYFPAVSEETGYDRRSIGQYNCYHKIFPIILGVSKPEHTNEQLQQMIDENHKGFELDGKKYSMYEGTQLQRKLEAKIREQKDLQVLGKTSGNQKLREKSQRNINQLNKKYKQLSDTSGLPTMLDRMRVSGYKPIKVKEKPANKTNILNLKDNEIFISAKENEKLANFYIENWEKEKAFNLRPQFRDKLEELKKKILEDFKDEIIDLSTFEGCEKLVSKVNGVFLGDKIKEVDNKLLSNTSKNLYNNFLHNKVLLEDSTNNFTVITADILDEDTIAETSLGNIKLNNVYYNNYGKLYNIEKEAIDTEWHVKVSDENIVSEPFIHELGHVTHSLASKKIAFSNDYNKELFKHLKPDEYGYYDYNAIRKELVEAPIRNIMEKENISKYEVIQKYVSIYGKSDESEMFAEMFANAVLGESNALGDELLNYLIELGVWEK